MGRHSFAAARAVAWCSRSTLMARALQLCTVLRQLILITVPTAKERDRLPDWFYPATPCMGRRWKAAVRAMALFSKSTPMAQVFRPCTVLRHLLLIIPTTLDLYIILTETEHIRRPG